MLVEHVEVGLDPGRVGFRHPGAVVSIAGVTGFPLAAFIADQRRQALTTPDEPGGMA